MKALALLWLAVVNLQLGRSNRVLVLAPICTKSHQYALMPILEALADKGHQVTVVSPFRISQAVNVREIVIQDVFDRFSSTSWFDRHEENTITSIYVTLKVFRETGILVYDILMVFSIFKDVTRICSQIFTNKIFS